MKVGLQRASMYALIWFVFLDCSVVALPKNEAEILGPDLASHYRHLQAQLHSSNGSSASHVPVLGLPDEIHRPPTVTGPPITVTRSPKVKATHASASAMSNGRQNRSAISAVSSTRKPGGSESTTSKSKVSKVKKDSDVEEVWPHKDDPAKAAEEAEASIATATVKHKPRMLNTPRTTRQQKDRSSVATAIANDKVMPKPEHEPTHSALPADRNPKWDSFKVRVPGSAHLRNGEFLHGGILIRGLSAVSSMKTATEVLRVPAELVLSKDNPAVQKFYSDLDWEEGGDPTWKLVAFLAASKRLGDQSRWAPYLAHLPKLHDFESFHPVWASEDLLHLFAPLPLLHDVREYRRRARTEWRQYEDFSQALEQRLADGLKSDEQTEALRKAALDVNEEDIRWAFTVVLTRGFGTPQGSALAPVADDLNTDSPFKLNVQWHGQQDGSLQLVTTASVSKGDELLTSYSAGLRNNDEFAASFGFALANNADEVATLAPRVCASMATAVKSRYGSKTPSHSKKCVPPQAERQPAVFCTLLALAKEHCPSTSFE